MNIREDEDQPDGFAHNDLVRPTCLNFGMGRACSQRAHIALNFLSNMRNLRLKRAHLVNEVTGIGENTMGRGMESDAE